MTALRTLALVALLSPLTACAVDREVPLMGSARITADFETYAIHRVGLVPFRALESEAVAAHQIGEVARTFHSELSTATRYDLVPLSGDDLAEVLPPDPFRQGSYTPHAIRTLRDRYRLDALLIGTITSQRVIAPQVIGAQLDLVSCETGATIWSADLPVDGSRDDVRKAIEVWADERLGDPNAAAITLLSPLKFTQFAAYQMSRLL